jgi:hypothetical protein
MTTDPAFLTFHAREFQERLGAVRIPGMDSAVSWDRKAAWLLWVAEGRAAITAKPEIELKGGLFD